MMHTIMHWIAVHGYGVIFVLLALGIFGLPLPNDLLLAYLGFLIFKGKLLLLPTVAAAVAGALCGMTINYALGRTFGLYLIHKFGGLLHITAEQLDRFHAWYERSGRWGLLFGYFLPGVRHLTAFAAGTSRMSFAEFAVFGYAGGFLWACTFMSLGYFLEDRWSHETKRIHHILVFGSLAALAILGLYILQQWIRKRRRARQRRAPEERGSREQT